MSAMLYIYEQAPPGFTKTTQSGPNFSILIEEFSSQVRGVLDGRDCRLADLGD